jgi:triosephosphate isomerase
MNGLAASLDEIDAMARGHAGRLSERLDMAVCVPFTLICEAARLVGNGGLTIGGQDCHAAVSGAHTGDVSAEMIADCGGRWIIVGHSERRTDHGESDDQARAKAHAAQRAGLTPILCVGESEAERRAGRALAVLESQLNGSLPDIASLVVAYEPVWAIGTGVTATTDDIGEVHGLIRKHLNSRYGNEGGEVRILYGGSVKPANASEILAVTDVNGALVGGASLKSGDLLAIAAACP